MFKHEKGVLLYTNFQLLVNVGKIANSLKLVSREAPLSHA